MDKNYIAQIIVFAGPNGSGKSTVTKQLDIVKPYINADDIKVQMGCTELEAAKIADRQRRVYVMRGRSFTFESVMSTCKNIRLLRSAKRKGYFIQCIYAITADVNVNVVRVLSRELSGGHGVPEDKIRSRYYRSLSLIPQVLGLCDVAYIYDNTDMPSLIFEKHKSVSSVHPNEFWSTDKIKKLISGKLYNIKIESKYL